MTHSQIMQMSKEELRFAVAEAFGWKPLKRNSIGQLLGRNNKYGGWKCVPDYTSDLNACREMEGTLDDAGRKKYGRELYLIIEPDEDYDGIEDLGVFKLAAAKSEIRCLAFLLATQKEAE